MHQIDRLDGVARILFGFDASTLFVRIDVAGRVSDLLSDGSTINLTFLRPGGVRVSLQMEGGLAVVTRWTRTPPDQWRALPGHGVAAAVGTIAEIAVPLGDLSAASAGWTAGALADVAFFVTVVDGRGSEVERHPVGRPIEAAVPDARFVASNWTA